MQTLGTRHGRAVAAAAALAITTGLGAGLPDGASRSGAARGCPAFAEARTTQRIATAKLFVEYNATDQDIGVQGAFDDDGWSRLCVSDPRGRRILDVTPRSRLRDQGMGAIFFESREPPARRFSFADLRRRFPEGRYAVRALSFDGKRLVGSALFTHDVPRRPLVTAPGDKATVDPADVRVAWEDVTRTVDGRPAAITGYEVIVTEEDHEDPHGFSQPVYDVHVPPDRNALRVPTEFFEPRTAYELEVLALERSGNQTISVSFFRTR